jgi:hypothetical protein
MWCCGRIPTFQSSMLPPSSGSRVSYHSSTQCHNPEELDMKCHCHEGFKTHNMLVYILFNNILLEVMLFILQLS